MKLVLLSLVVVLIIMSVTPVMALDLDEGLVAYYSFDNIEGKILKDDSGNGHDGIIYGNPKIVNGIKGKALEFDGVDDYILIDDSDVSYSAITVACWVYSMPEYGDQGYGLITKANYPDWSGGTFLLHPWKKDNHWDIGWYVYTDQVKHTTENNARIDVEDLEYQEWYFIVGTYDGEFMKIYVNGELIATKKLVDNLQNSASPIHIAHDSRYKSEVERFFKGIIDEVRIYNRALSEEEIKALYEQTLHPTLKPKLTLTIECDTYLKQGEIRQAELTAENTGDADAKNVKITITSPSLGINIQKDYDTIPSKEARTVTFQVSPSEAGKFKITAMAEYWDDQGNKYIETAEKIIEVEPIPVIPTQTTTTPVTTVETPKKPPVAVAGDDVTVYEGSEVILSALASYDPDGEIVSYQWIDERGITISTSPILRQTFPVGSHVITLRVTDNDGLTSTDTVKVTVLARESGKPSIIVSQSALTAKEGLLTITIANVGDSDAYDVHVLERIPSEIAISYVNGATSTGALITWDGNLKAGESHTIEHSLRLLTDEAIIPVTVKYKDPEGKQNEIHTNIFVKPTETEKPAKTQTLPISEETLIIIVALIVVSIVVVAFTRRKPPKIEIKE